MQKEEKMVSRNPHLRRPKQEEVPILEDGNSSQKPIDPDGKDNIMEDLECIFGFQDDHKFGGAGYMLTNDWHFMTWDEISNVGLKEECDDVDPDHHHHKMKMEEDPFEECDNDGNIAVKRENLGFWEEEKTISLNLNYQDVLDAWSDGRSPWADDYSLLTSNDTYMGGVPVMEEVKMRREARVLRYKEKRQSRLFSKKIRYQVRKLNAEKRPRLKGRFVKRIPDKIVR